MSRLKVFLSLIFLTSIASVATMSHAQARPPAHYFRQRGVHRVGAVRVGAPALRVAADSIKVDLFPDVSFRIHVNHIEATAKDGTTWSGDVEGAPYGNATFVQTDHGMIGAITRGDGKMYQVRTEPDGTQWGLEIDQSSFPDEADPLPVPVAPGKNTAFVEHDALAYSDDGSTIDVLVLYTTAARIAAGGTTQMQSLVQLGVALTNQGYSNSGVIQRVHLVASQEVNYTEASSISTDLARLANPADGYLDEGPALRNSYGADVVSLWVSTNEPACGIGYQMTDSNLSSSAMAPYAYSVVELNCATDNYTFGHEMGHNMGANHARDDLDSTAPHGAYPYAFGYKQTTGTKFRTIMAYDTHCTCPRVDYWSNPNVKYSNTEEPTGIDPSSSQGAANYLVLNNTRTIVANFRASLTGGGPPGDSTGPALAITSHTNGQTVSTNSITISGTASDSGKGDSGISSVTVNGTRATNDTATGSATARWSRTLTLNSGPNTITVIAADASSSLNTTSVTITINAPAAVVTSATANTYHVFPQFADGRLPAGDYYRTTLMISNPSSTTGTGCTLQLHGLTVPGFSLTYSLGQAGWVISQTSGTQNFTSGYATLQCTASVEAQLLYSYYAPDGTKISEATVFSSPPAASVRILADEREGAQVGLAIANDTDQTVTYSIGITNVALLGSVTLGPRSSVAKFLSEFVSGIPVNNLAQVQVSASNGTASIIGLRFTGGVFTTIGESIRSFVDATASTLHVFPQFADGKYNDGSYYRTTRMYVNPNSSTTATCTTLLRGMTTDGLTKFTASLSPGISVIAPTSGTQAFQSGYATLQCSASVDAQTLYSFYAANGVKLSEATVFSSPSAQRTQILADSRGGSRVGLAIANDSDQTTTYTITVGDANGSVVATAVLTVPARTSVAKFVDELPLSAPLPANHYGPVIVSSSTGTASIIGLRFTGTTFTTIPETIR